MKEKVEQITEESREILNKIKKMFEGIYTVMESHEFENYCEKLRNIDANKYREIL